jgi:hypothetical protein
VVDGGGGNGTFGAGNADALQQLFTAEFLTGTIALDDERYGQNGPFVSRKALSTRFTFAAATNSATRIVSGINDTRLIVLTVRTAQFVLLVEL